MHFQRPLVTVRLKEGTKTAPTPLAGLKARRVKKFNTRGNRRDGY